MNWKCPTSLSAVIISCIVATGSVLRAAEGHYYGVVESFGGGEVVVKTTKHSTGHWKVDSSTRIDGSIARYDWIFVEMGRGGTAAVLKFEERPTTHVGVVKIIDGVVLSVHSGASIERWNVVETTLGDAAGVAVGDEVSVKVYGNHNLAEVRVLKHGIK
jgi:hypothetical protein